MKKISILKSKINDSKKDLVTVEVGIRTNEARQLLNKYKIEKLPVVDKNFRLQGLITMKDIEKVSNTHIHPKTAKED